MNYICIHGHFYQPSRVDPWTRRWDPQPSAGPFRDWNDRIASECYAPNAAARLLDGGGNTRVLRNTYADIQFDFGPTLLDWLGHNRPVILEALRTADRDSITRFGRGSAMAQPYHHPILPLCDDADRRTEVAWGLAVFRRVFGRDAEGMWLPETAVDTPTLEVLAAQGVTFVVLAPRQIAEVERAPGVLGPAAEGEAAGRAYRIPLPSGREIVAVGYDHHTSNAVAFHGALHHGGQFAERLVRAAGRTGLALVATDGESYGHHHAHGEMALAYAAQQIDARGDVALTNLASWLAHHPPTLTARIREGSSWSCAHGLGRWKADCGCQADPSRGWHQRWRAPLRSALEGLRDHARAALAESGAALFTDAAAARDAYGEVLGRPDRFADWYAPWGGQHPDPERARQWLDAQVDLLAMFTSCAWFFDEATGLEPRQNLRHAGAAVGRIRALTGVDLAPAFIAAVSEIPANLGSRSLVETVEVAAAPRAAESLTPGGISASDRRAGLLQPVSALDGAGPIGDLDGAIPLVDWLAAAGMGAWQVLPLNPTDALGSPYTSASALAGNPDLVGLEGLFHAGLLPQGACLPRTDAVDYAAARQLKRPRVFAAARTLLARGRHPWSEDLRRFMDAAKWAQETALFMALRAANGGTPWWEWPEPLRRRAPAALAKAQTQHAEQIAEWQAALYLFERQWKGVRRHAAARGVKLIGDVPIYVGEDSVDVWANQKLFQLEPSGRAAEVAGAPPDAYSEAGQRWGNPLYDWEAMAAADYRWWIERVRRGLEHCDVLRLDHFIGFSRYWAIPSEDPDARGGRWRPGPGRAVFDAIAGALGRLPFIAEDLGSVDAATEVLRDGLGLPGMKVMVFGLDGNPRNPHHPQNHPRLSVAYPSTHDSETAAGWWVSRSHDERVRLRGELSLRQGRPVTGLVDTVLAGPACWAVLPMQDVLGDTARTNTPGTVEDNWVWRQPAGVLRRPLADSLRRRIRRAGRLVPQAFRADSAPTAAAGSRAHLVGPSVAYFCMEYGISHTLPIYSGGLGVLAGDIVKAAADAQRDFVAIGILWGEGYFVQDIDERGQSPRYVPTPRDRLRPTGAEVTVTIAGEEMPITAWRVPGMGSVELLLLEPVRPEHRWISARLYGGGVRDRVAQELLLGVGGVRILRELGMPIERYHFNEGHALFAGFELVRERMALGASMPDALAGARAETVFTTHTPVPAGNEVHPLDLLWEMGAHLDTFTREQLREIGGDPFEMTPAALRMSHVANAVAELHGRTARKMWTHVQDAAPIRSITNGVHLPTWQDGALATLAAGGSDDALWTRHQELKARLLEEIRERTGATLDADSLLVGFARRAATYKRATLLLRDRVWLEAQFSAGRLQLVFAGKAHPADTGGGALIAELVVASRQYPDRLVFLPGYDMHLGAALTRGCDVWLNNPIRPKEASGTSGMKAAANGVLNLSVLDGWWDEGCAHGENGWGVGAPPEGANADTHDYQALRSLLEDEVMPLYAGDRARWTAMMRASISTAERRFSAARMVRRYGEELYSPEPA